MMITRSRTDTAKNPNIPAVQKWISNKYDNEIKLAETKSEIKKVTSLYKDIPDDYIWIEYVKSPLNLSGKFLCCFSVLRKGYGVADAKIDYTSLSDVIAYFKIPTLTVNNYTDLVKAIKSGETSVLFKVKSGSGQYGIVVDNRLTDEQRYRQIINTLSGVSFNIAVNYSGESFTIANPHVGEVALTWPGFNTTTLEVYPLEEIISL